MFRKFLLILFFLAGLAAISGGDLAAQTKKSREELEREKAAVQERLKEFDAILTVHLRSEVGQTADNISILDALDEAIYIGKETGVKIEISHLKFGKPFNNISIEDFYYASGDKKYFNKIKLKE